MMRHFEIMANNPDDRIIREIAGLIDQGKVGIVPTDSVYGIVCRWDNKKAIQKLCKIVDKKEKLLNLSLLCIDLKMGSQYARPFDNRVFRMMKRLSPGPYTFIVESDLHVQRVLKSSKKEIGLRYPDHIILQRLIENTGYPLMSTSLNKEGPEGYYREYGEIVDAYGSDLDFFLDGGEGGLEPSTVLDCTGGEVELIRQGKGLI